MAIYHLHTQAISRADGRSAPAAAAYRAGERIRDEGRGRVYNHSRRQDVVHREIVLPNRRDGADMSWAQDRARLWNMAEQAEHQRNSRVAREYQVALPAELSPAQRLGLAQAFSADMANRHQIAVDLAVHEPRPRGDPRNHHAHLLVTTREVSPAGLGAKTGLDQSGRVRMARGLVSGRAELIAIRARWATLTNEALREAGLAARVDHRSLAAQGIQREPQPHIPWAAYEMERRGLHSEVAQRIRAGYEARVAARQERAHGDAALSGGPLQDLEAVRRQAREDWLQLRAQPALRQATSERVVEADHDLGL